MSLTTEAVGSVRRPLARLLAAAVALVPSLAVAQTFEDGLTIARHELRTSVGYATDRWSQYWEGTHLRTNDNIGALTTNSVTTTVSYGVTRNLMLAVSDNDMRRRQVGRGTTGSDYDLTLVSGAFARDLRYRTHAVAEHVRVPLAIGSGR